MAPAISPLRDRTGSRLPDDREQLKFAIAWRGSPFLGRPIAIRASYNLFHALQMGLALTDIRRLVRPVHRLAGRARQGKSTIDPLRQLFSPPLCAAVFGLVTMTAALNWEIP
jgi:hypothetical protein